MRKGKIETTIINGLAYLRCNCCGAWKEMTEENFYKDKNGTTVKFKAKCKDCTKKYYNNNREVRNNYQKEYSKKHREYYNAYSKEYNKTGSSNLKVSDFKENSVTQNDSNKLIKQDGELIYNNRKFTRLVGGFGEDKPIITTKQIAELIGFKNKVINQTINRHIKDFTSDYLIDLKSVTECDHYIFSSSDINYTDTQWNNSKHIYILSEAGFLLYLKFAEGDKAVNLYKDFVEDYFKTKAELKVAKEKIVEIKEESKQALQDTKTMLLGKVVLSNNEKERLELLTNIEGINRKLINIIKNETIEELEEKYKKINSVETIINKDVTMTMDEFCKSINVKGYGRNNMFKYLRNKKVLKEDNTPYSTHLEKFNIKNNTSNKRVYSQPLVTNEGAKYIIKMLKKDNLIDDSKVDEINKLIEEKFTNKNN